MISMMVRARAQSAAERLREYVLNSAKPGRRRNFTVRDSQEIETTLFQRSGVIVVLPPSSSNRMAGYGEART